MKRVLASRTVSGLDCFSETNAIGRASLFPLERDLLEVIVTQALGGNEMWRRQIGHLQVRSRSFTDKTFLSRFLLADPTMVVMPFVANEVVSGWIRTELPGGAGSLDHVLYLERGTMVALEGMARNGELPAEIGQYRILNDRG
ncbi:MAG TPA: hypothetical protein VHA10_23680 [Hypericibacter adhaerens]|jgi:hypothetical protein|uniref:Uncharacterized protein n=1 Tax=Hypericibacter adhaerens TaxID=2602016 RepID=A0A5J6N0Y9_9PROT|nr:hypothetical protein [Hypericibacter adhaerens]QEX23499.1 hypothetical protein FRZ61_34370 [Hypericibacter adhaerens]HWA46238.1 hypothetical protein [Hypericibacter adhaerens]